MEARARDPRYDSLGAKKREKGEKIADRKRGWRQRKYFIWDFITPGHLWVKISTDPAVKLSKQSDGSICVFTVYTQQDSRLRAASPCVFFMNKPQLWRLIGKDVVSQFKPVSAGVPVTSIRLVNIITLGLMVSHVGGVSVSKSSVVPIPCLQNMAATVCLAQRTLSSVAARCSSLEPLEPRLISEHATVAHSGIP